MCRSAFVFAALLWSAVALAQELPLTGVQYGPAPFDRKHPQVASDGTNFLAAWRDARTGDGSLSIFAARFSPDGQLLDEPTAIGVPDVYDRAPNLTSNSPPVVAWTGRVFVVAWDDPALPGMQLVRIDRDGHLLDARPRALVGLGMTSGGAAASAGGRTLIVWSRNVTAEGDEALGATLLDADGEVLIGHITISRRLDSGIAVASNGSGFLATWRRWNGTNNLLMVATISRDAVFGTAREAGRSLGSPVIAANGADYLVAHVDVPNNLALERFDANGNSLGSNPLWYEPTTTSLAIGPYGSGYIGAYTYGTEYVRTFIVDLNGKLLNERSFNASGHAHGTMAFASNGSATAVVWPEADDVFAQPMRLYARVLDVQSGQTLLSRSAPLQSNIRAATNGNGYLAAFLDWPAGGALRAARVTANGARLDAGGILIDATGVQEPAQVAFDGSNYVVAWMRHGQCGLRVSRIAPDGTLLDGVGGRVIEPAACVDFGIGSNGAETLLVWSGTGDDPTIYAQRMKQDGTLDPALMRIPSRERGGLQFSVAWSRGTWLVAWRESYVEIPRFQFPVYQYNVLAARISDGGTVLDGVPIVVAESPLAESMPAVAANGRDFLVAWREATRPGVSTILARHVGVDGMAGDVIEVAASAGEERSTVSKELSAMASGASYVVAWEEAGDLFLSAVGSGIRAPLAVSRAEEHSVTILPTAGGAVAFYDRIAAESEYGKVLRAFFRFVGISSRTRAARH